MRHSVLIFLDLSDNRLSGELPNCWMQFKNLSFLNLANNHFSGKLPASLGYLPQIGVLHLCNNKFYGEMPSFQNCKYLSLLDLGENRISGKLPEWLVQSREYLVVLRLSSNESSGSIPTSWCSLQALQILDLSQNNLSGALPHCFNNMTAMKSEVTNYGQFDVVNLTWKGIKIEFGRNLYLMRSIDISSNHLSGVIPESITSLLKLKSLNLSINNLTGSIPGNFDQLKDLESLDLSTNRICGKIPTSFSRLTFLSKLDLSYNKLTGRIPSSTQLQGFPASAFMGNAGLFGPPLTEDLPKNRTKQDPGVVNDINKANEDGYITFGFYVSSAIGFIVGFWGICGTLLISSSWRLACFRFWNRTEDWIYVTTRVSKARLLRRLTNHN
ncbi:LRR domain containing protein [Trema orientale]|uniref:LRR domain containing protein n=1 Tax=Trema orientale TaxID=63057 RepID=A0A2P5ADY6_TREOI|nr:LRR domain containing protein [Trema orientale]